MMRELRFRVWDVDGRAMIYGQTAIDAIPLAEANPETIFIMQYTGLPDKRGVEIYEGDIVKHPLCVKEPHEADESCATFIGRIQFEVDRGQYLAINTKQNGYVIALSEAYKFEVIGNIYESPELLEVEHGS